MAMKTPKPESKTTVRLHHSRVNKNDAAVPSKVKNNKVVVSQWSK